MLVSMHLSGWTSTKPAPKALAERYSLVDGNFQKMAVEEGMAVLKELFQMDNDINEVKEGHALNFCYVHTH